MSQLFDPGLQPERTALAWRRTGLSLTVGSLIALRVLPAVLGLWALAPALLGLVASVAVMVASHRRYQLHHAVLTTSASDRVELGRGFTDGAGLPALVAAITALLGVAALVVAFGS